MKTKRLLAALAVAGGMLGLSASEASAARPKCPPGQTAVITVVGIDVVTTCRFP